MRNTKLKAARAEKDMTQKDLADAVGATRQTVNAIEQGDCNPTLRLCRSICAVLGIDPSFAATLMIIGTICDIPATLVNSTSNLVASALVDRIAGRKNG